MEKMSVPKYAMNACVLFLSLKPQYFTANNQLKDLVKKTIFYLFIITTYYLSTLIKSLSSVLFY